MERQIVIDWLNLRLKRASVTQFDDSDVDFIKSYIYHYKNESVDRSWIIYSMQGIHVNELLYRIDSMMNKLIIDFNIVIETEERIIQNVHFNIMTGQNPMAKSTVSMIKLYK